MPIIYYGEGKQNTLEMEPYRFFCKELEEKQKEGLNGSSIEKVFYDKENGIVDGFSIDDYYSRKITLKFLFEKTMTIDNEEVYVIRHDIEIEFDENEDCFNTLRVSMEEIRKKADHLYIDGAKYLEFKYYMGDKNSQIIFTVLASEEDIKKVCCQMINMDIALFARGW